MCVVTSVTSDSLQCYEHNPQGSSVHRILQARIVSGLPWLPPGDLSDPGSEPESHIFCIGRQVLYYYFLRILLNPCGSGPRREKTINEIMKTIEWIWCLICYTVLYFILYCLISFYIKRKWFILAFGKPR